MTRNEINTYLCAVLTTLADLDGQPAPRSSLYLALNMEIARFEMIETLLTKAGLVTVTSETMKLTDAGRAMVVKIKAAIPGV